MTVRKKPLRRLFYIVASVMLTILLLGFVAKKSITVEARRTIKVPPSMLGPRIDKLEAQHEWSWVGRQSPSWSYKKVIRSNEYIGAWTDGSWMSQGTVRMLPPLIDNVVETEVMATRPWQILVASKIAWLPDDEYTDVRWMSRVVRPFPFNLYHLSSLPSQDLEQRMQHSLDLLQAQLETSYMLSTYRVREVPSEMWYCIDSQDLDSVTIATMKTYAGYTGSPLWRRLQGNSLGVWCLLQTSDEVADVAAGLHALDYSSYRTLSLSVSNVEEVQAVMASLPIDIYDHQRDTVKDIFISDIQASINGQAGSQTVQARLIIN